MERASRDEKGMRIPFVKSSIIIVSAVTLLLGGSLVEPVNRNGKGMAIKGYDPVAYFKQGAPVKGTPQFAQQWMGATFLFANAENRDLFAASPEQYAPRYGGYCAYAVSEGHTANIDPEAWKIVDGKLYLNYSKGVPQKWAKELESRISRADKNWPSLHK